VRKAFEDWRVKTHTVTDVDQGANSVGVKTTTGTHEWLMTAGGFSDRYKEATVGAFSDIYDDDTVGATDHVFTDPLSESQPTSSLQLSGPGLGDDSFLDVIIY
jgi:hypothetical protein